MKERFRKYYRHLELDTRLTKERTKAEVRAIQRCQEVCLFVYTLIHLTLLDFISPKLDRNTGSCHLLY